jgi:hypothetical protein
MHLLDTSLPPRLAPEEKPLACKRSFFVPLRSGPASLPRSFRSMIPRYTHLRPDFMRDELARVPDFTPKNAAKIVEIAPVAPQLAVAV